MLLYSIRGERRSLMMSNLLWNKVACRHYRLISSCKDTGVRGSQMDSDTLFWTDHVRTRSSLFEIYGFWPLCRRIRLSPPGPVCLACFTAQTERSWSSGWRQSNIQTHSDLIHAELPWGLILGNGCSDWVAKMEPSPRSASRTDNIKKHA